MPGRPFESQPRYGEEGKSSTEKPYEFGQYAEELRTKGVPVSVIGFRGDMDIEQGNSPLQQMAVDLAVALRDQRGHFIFNRVQFVEDDVHQGEMKLSTGIYRLNEIEPGSPGLDTIPENTVMVDLLPNEKHLRNHARSLAKHDYPVVVVTAGPIEEQVKAAFQAAFEEFDDSRATVLIAPLTHLSTSEAIRAHLVGEAIEFLNTKRAPSDRRKIFPLEDALAYARAQTAPQS